MSFCSGSFSIDNFSSFQSYYGVNYFSCGLFLKKSYVLLTVQLYQVMPFILELDCLKQGIMPCIWVACIAMNTLIFYGVFITHTLCVHVTVKKILRHET